MLAVTLRINRQKRKGNSMKNRAYIVLALLTLVAVLTAPILIKLDHIVRLSHEVHMTVEDCEEAEEYYRNQRHCISDFKRLFQKTERSYTASSSEKELKQFRVMAKLVQRLSADSTASIRSTLAMRAETIKSKEITKHRDAKMLAALKRAEKMVRKEERSWLKLHSDCVLVRQDLRDRYGVIPEVVFWFCNKFN